MQSVFKMPEMHVTDRCDVIPPLVFDCEQYFNKYVNDGQKPYI